MRYLGLFIKKLLRYLLKPLSFVPALLVMYMIFSFSSQDGAASAKLSWKVSSRVASTVNQVLEKGWDDAQLGLYTERIHYYVRKTAHVTEYFVLAVTVAFPLYVYRVRGIWLILAAGAFCVAFAGLDEYHQSFVAGRGASARDVAIDSMGAFAGVIITQLLCFIGRKTLFRPLALKRR